MDVSNGMTFRARHKLAQVQHAFFDVSRCTIMHILTSSINILTWIGTNWKAMKTKRLRLHLRLYWVVGCIIGDKNEECECTNREEEIMRCTELSCNHFTNNSLAVIHPWDFCSLSSTWLWWWDFVLFFCSLVRWVYQVGDSEWTFFFLLCSCC